MVTDQHGASDSSAFRALGSHEKVDSHSKEGKKSRTMDACSFLLQSSGHEVSVHITNDMSYLTT